MSGGSADYGSEVLIGFVAPHGDPLVLLQLAEQVLDRRSGREQPRDHDVPQCAARVAAEPSSNQSAGREGDDPAPDLGLLRSQRLATRTLVPYVIDYAGNFRIDGSGPQ